MKTGSQIRTWATQYRRQRGKDTRGWLQNSLRSGLYFPQLQWNYNLPSFIFKVKIKSNKISATETLVPGIRKGWA